MERYDGKTKKDDIKRGLLIVLGIILLLLGYKLVTYILFTVSHPEADVTVVIATDKVVDYGMEKSLKHAIEDVIVDFDGNGKSVVDVEELQMGRNMAMNEEGLNGVVDYGITLPELFKTGSRYVILITDAQETEKYAAYCNPDYCVKLLEDLQSENPYVVNLTGCTVFSGAQWRKLPLYGCIHKNATEEEQVQALAILWALKELT